MAIKDIFTMIKADRYTQDGREELIKASESITEDITYKPGDISRKTGLQKQPDGSWAPVKNAPQSKMNKAKQSEIKKQAAFEKQMGDPAKARADYWKEIKEASEKPMPGVEELYNKTVEKKSEPGIPIRGENWMSLPSGTRMTFEGAKEKMAQNSQRIEALKKSMEGKSFADNFRAGIELKKLENENEYIAERLPPEMRETPSESASTPSASGSLREQTPAIREKEESITANEADKFYEGFGLKKTGEHVDSKGWTVKEYKNDSGETWTGKFNKEGKYVGSEYVPSSGSASTTTPKLGLQKGDTAYTKYGERAEILEVDGDRVLTKLNGHTEWHSERAFEGKINKPTESKPTGSAPSDLKIQGMSKEEYIPWRMKTYKENEAQASSMWNHFAEQQKNKGNENEYDPDFHPLRDSAPRILTGDCKVRIKKSK